MVANYCLEQYRVGIYSVAISILLPGGDTPDQGLAAGLFIVHFVCLAVAWTDYLLPSSLFK